MVSPSHIEWSRNGQGMNWIRLEKRLAIYHRDGFDCVYCRLIFPLDPLGYGLTLDHLEASRENGRTLNGCNEPDNLVTTCLSCNSAKQHRPMEEWLTALRRRGFDSRVIRARIARHIRKPIDREVGKYLAWLRRNRRAHVVL